MEKSNGKEKGLKNLVWTHQMGRVLIDTLTEQLASGNKGDTGWKGSSYREVVKRMDQELQLTISVDNVRNRLKIWRNHFIAVKECLSHTGFEWDDALKRITASHAVWDEHLKTNKKHAVYRTKHFANWDEIVPLVCHDQVVRNQGKTANGCNEIGIVGDKSVNEESPGTGNNLSIEDTIENDANLLGDDTPKLTPSPNTSSLMSQGGSDPSQGRNGLLKRKRITKGKSDIASALESIAESMKRVADAMVERTKTKTVDVNELLRELRKVPGSNSMVLFEVAEYIMSDFQRTSLFLALTVEERKMWLTKRFPLQMVCQP
ncbi:hypothetical protein MKW98_000525 [Papaver atlanticum]|uniref:Myb/SANT-like domain-containing protein n=1 Tax=Papaver atlanticum TaxID=357466 RepID=A0AAD4S4Q4_9MAGN|nr:hypothetical protein MKW98_000525 [Papaver atlanticum]